MAPTPTPTSTSTPTVTFDCNFEIDVDYVAPTPTPTATPTPTSTTTITPTVTFDCNFDIDVEYVAPTPTPTVTPTSTSTPTPTSTPTITPTPTVTLDCNFEVDVEYVAPTPTPTLTPTPTSTSTVTPTETPTSTSTPTVTPTVTPTSTSTPTETITPTPTVTLDCNFNIDVEYVAPTPTPTVTPTSTSTSTPTVTPTVTPTSTSTSTNTPTVTPTSTSTPTPTSTPTITPTPTVTLDCNFNIDVEYVAPTPTPTVTPTSTSTSTPTNTPTVTPTVTPTTTSTPTVTPTTTPTPTNTPTVTPTVTPTTTSTPTSTPTFTPTSTPTNSAPTDIVLSNNSVNENSSINTIVGTLSSVDNVGDTHTYTIQSGGSLFNISGNSLRTSQSFNYESASSHSVTIRSTDNGGLSFDKTFTINVNNVNEAPFGLNFSGSIPENSAIDTTVGTVTTLDVDSGDTFTYSLVDTVNYPDNSSFTITSGGVLKSAAVFNFETKSSYSIKVRTTDAGGLTFDGVLTVPVTNVNETPTNLELSSSSISENVPVGTTIGTLSSTDPDSGDTFTYSLVDGGSYPDNSSFTIDGSSLKSAVIFNFENKSSYSIRVRTTDVGGLTFNKTLTITITDVTISVTASATTNVTCNGGSNGVITVSNVVGGTVNYTYSKDGTNYQSSNVFSGLTAGSYTIYAKDSYSEVGSTSVSVTQPTVVSATVTGTNVSCNNGSDGSIVVSNLSGGQGGPYSSKLNAGGTYQVITTSRTYSSLTQGSYTIFVKDSSGCEVSYAVTLTHPEVLTASISVVTQPNCDSSGVVQVSSNGGTFPKTYEVFEDNTFPYNDCTSGTLVATFTNVTSANTIRQVTNLTSSYSYCLKVTDANGCVTTSSQIALDDCYQQIYTHGAVRATCSDYCTTNYNVTTLTNSNNDYTSLSIGDTIYGQGGIAGFVAYSNVSTDTFTGPIRIAQIDSNGIIQALFICVGSTCEIL